MSLREQLIYAEMIAEDERKTAELRAIDPKAARIVTEPIEQVFFFPTMADVKIAKKWLDRDITTSNDTRTLATALRLVAARIAVPLACLEIVRRLEDDR
jgi:competence transcription factor ComK